MITQCLQAYDYKYTNILSIQGENKNDEQGQNKKLSKSDNTYCLCWWKEEQSNTTF